MPPRVEQVFFGLLDLPHREFDQQDLYLGHLRSSAGFFVWAMASYRFQ
jgi:hypothetical protein